MDDEDIEVNTSAAVAIQTLLQLRVGHFCRSNQKPGVDGRVCGLSHFAKGGVILLEQLEQAIVVGLNECVAVFYTMSAFLEQNKAATCVPSSWR